MRINAFFLSVFLQLKPYALPLCSCGVIPTSVGLRREGASHGACTSFLIATPQTGVDSITATYSMMGLPFAIIRPVAALFTAMFGGWMVNRFAREDEQHSAQAVLSGEHDHCHCGHRHEHEEESCSCHHEHEGESCACHHEQPEYQPLITRFINAMRYAFVEMLQTIGRDDLLRYSQPEIRKSEVLVRGEGEPESIIEAEAPAKEEEAPAEEVVEAPAEAPAEEEKTE